MRTALLTWVAAAGCLLAAIAWPGGASQVLAADAAKARVLILSGPSQHPPGTHETAAGARLLKHALEHAQGVPAIRADVVSEWPGDKQALSDVATIVCIGDIFPGETMKEPARIKADLAALMARGCGLVCLHYATGLRAAHVAEDGDHPLLHWLGGYFATGCKHHRSVARVVKAKIEPGAGQHPVLRGWKAFEFDDEPYWNNYFGPGGMAKNVKAVAYGLLPPEEPQREVVAWATERPDGGRGVGIVMPHFFRNWKNDDLRTMVLNGICWSAKLDIPAPGVQTTLPDLAGFEPAAVEPPPPPQKKPAAK